MATQTVPVFKSTLKKTEDWLDEIMELLDWDDRRQAYRALRVVLHLVRDRLTVEEATDLAAQFPMLIRGMFFDSWNPHKPAVRVKTAQQFVDSVNKHFDQSLWVESQDITRAVLKVVQRHVSKGEIDDVIFSLPLKLLELWD